MSQRSSNLPTIICMSPSNWDTPWWVDRHYLMAGLANRGWPVIYSSGLMSTWNRGSEEWRASTYFDRFETTQVPGGGAVTVDFPGKLSAIVPRFSSYTWAAKWRHAKRLRSQAQAVGNTNRLIYFACGTEFAPYCDLLKPEHVVCHINDAWAKFDDWTEQKAKRLDFLMDRAELITTVAQSMVDNADKKYAHKIRVVPHGVYSKDYRQGPKQPCPADLENIPSPRIGYVGRISRKVDLDSVYEIARRKPEWHWVFVGKVGVGFSGYSDSWDALERCKTLNNIHFLGPRDQQEMPAYMGHMDVNTMCYKSTGGYWELGNPLKLYEYLGVGKPVVGVDIENIRLRSDLVDVVGTVDEWVGAIDRALASGGVGAVEERLRAAQENDWENRVNLLEDSLLEMTALSEKATTIAPLVHGSQLGPIEEMEKRHLNA